MEFQRRHSSHCPVCGSMFRNLRHEWLFRCDKCGLLSSTLRPAIPKERNETILDEGTRLAGLYEVRKRSNAVILDRLTKLFGDTERSLLDVGSGHGLLLRDAAARGYRIEGLEPDANVVASARTITSAPVRQGFFPDAIGKDERFDGIIFNDVLEHIPALENAIEASYQLLRPGGILVLNCPDQKGAFYRLSDWLDRVGFTSPFRRMWQYDLPSPHLWYFSANHLVELGRKVGFKQLDIVRMAPVSASGLWHRITYVRGQSRLLNHVTFLGAMALLPILGILPRDTMIIFFQRPKTQA